MGNRFALRAASALAGLAALLASAPVPAAEVGPEPVGTIASARVPNRILVGDIAINHIVDGRLHFLDADTGRYLGLIGTGFAGQFTRSPDRREIYVATTYLSRGTRGERTDVLEAWDADSLALRHEIAISGKRAQALNYRGYLRTSADGRLAYVQNATPATSVSIVDLVARKQVGEIETPGCWAIYPAASHPRRFSTLCGDGTIQTLTLAEDGASATRAQTGKVFDPDADALFVQAEQDGDRYRFLSFTGNTVVFDLGAEKAVEVERWSLATAAQRAQGWRPGGYQPFAVDHRRGRLYVGMHAKGGEGSHKVPAQRIWIIDLARRSLVGTLRGRNAIALAVPPSGAGMLYLIDGLTNGVVVLSGPPWSEKRRVQPVGDASIQLDGD